MGKKVNPEIFRIGHTKTWKSLWFNVKKDYRYNLRQDVVLREFLMKKLSKSSVDRIEIKRTAGVISVIIYTARPGLLIGRGGDSVEKLKEEIKKILNRESGENHKKNEKIDIKIQIEQISEPEIYANIIAQGVVEQLEKRLPFRRIMKQSLEKIMQSKKAQGAKIMLGGRLGGTEIARREWLDKGKLPLQTLRADIDYAQQTAHTTYGTIGIKVWIYRGEIFNNKPVK